jgi:non-specific serine/threonine protein kinase
VCDPERDLPIDVLEGVASLADKSLLQRLTEEERRSEPRFGMLETIRQYAWEGLETRGEAPALRERHARFFLALAERAEPELHGPRQQEWLDHLERDHDNLRSALRWSLETGEAETGLRLGAALWRFWHLHPDQDEGRSRLAVGRELLDALLALPRGRDLVRAKALNAAGALADDQGDTARAECLHRESMAIARECGDTETIAYALLSLGNVAIRRKSYPQGKALYEEALPLWRSLGRPAFVARLLNNLGYAAIHLGQPEEAVTLFEESLAIKRKLGNPGEVANTLNNLGYLAVTQRNDGPAARHLCESLRLFQQLGEPPGIAEALTNLARLAREQGDPDRASVLLAAVARLVEESGVPLPSDHEENVAAVRASLDEEAFARAWSRGLSLTLEQALADVCP